MPSPIPAALALNAVSNGTIADASPVESNFVNIQAAVNALITALGGGTLGQVLEAADGTDVQWLTPPWAKGVYRKTTAKQVVNSNVETDLLNGEIMVGAGVIGASGVLRLSAWGDWLNNTGANQITPRFKLKLGATTLIDTATIATNWAFNAGRMGWEVCAKIENLGAANTQWASLNMDVAGFFTGAGASTFTTGEGINQIVTSNYGKIVGGNSGAVDTTVAQALAFTVTNPVANAALDVTLKGALVEIV